MDKGTQVLIGLLGVVFGVVAIVALSIYFNLENNRIFATNGYVECTLQGSSQTHWCKTK